MAFNFKNIFTPGANGETGVLNATSSSEVRSPFLMGDHAEPGSELPPQAMGFPGFGSPSQSPGFKPINEQVFGAQPEPQRSMGGGGPVTSPFSMGASPTITVGEVMPSLPVEVVRANGAPMDQPINIPQHVLDAAAHEGGVPLFEIFRVCPGLFQVAISPADHRRVQLPRFAARGPVAPPPSAPPPSPFSMGQADHGQVPGASPFATFQPSGGVDQGSAPSSRPVGALPPRRPEGVPPAIPTQSDFAAPPALQLPTFGAFPGAGAPAPAAHGSDAAPPNFASAPGASPFSAQPSAFGFPPQGNPQDRPGAFPAFPTARPESQSVSPPAPGASPFASFDSMPPSPPPSGSAFPPSGFSFGGNPQGNPPPTSRPLNPPAAQAGLAGLAQSAPPAFAMPPAQANPQDSVEFSLSSLVKGHSPQDLGFDPSFIPSWITTKLPSHLVRQQGAGEAKVELGVIIDGTDESFRPVIAHGKRDFRVALPINEVFHSLPQVNGLSNPTGRLSAAYPAAPEPAQQPAPPTPQAAPAPSMGSNPGPSQPINFQPQNLFGNLFPAQSSPAPASPPTPAAPPANPALGSWQNSAAPDPLFREQATPPPQRAPEPPAQATLAPAMPKFEMPSWEPTPQPQQTPVTHQPPAPPAFPTFGSPQSHAPEIGQGMRSFSVSAQAPMGRDQLMLRAMLGVAGPVSKADVVRHFAALPGVEACFYVAGPEVLTHGQSSPSGAVFQRQAADMATGIQAIAQVSGLDVTEPFTFDSPERSITFMVQEPFVLALLHTDRNPVAGLKEKVAVLCKELAAM